MMGEKGGRETWGEEEEADIEEGEERESLMAPCGASRCLNMPHSSLDSGRVFIVSTREILIAFCNQKFT